MTINIAVLVKQIPDPAQDGQLGSDFRFKREGKIVLDESDLFGVEVALRLRDANGQGQVHLVSMAPNGESAGVRTALAMGADRAVVISDEALENAHALATAKVLNAAIDRIGDIDLVIGATESSDGYTGTVPAQIAGLRQVSCLTFATSVELENNTIKIARQSNDGIDLVTADLPAVVSVTAGVVEPRYPNFKGIMEAKSKEVEVVNLGDLNLSADDLKIASQKVISLKDAPQRESGVLVTDTDQAATKIIEYLQNSGVI